MELKKGLLLVVPCLALVISFQYYSKFSLEHSQPIEIKPSFIAPVTFAKEKPWRDWRKEQDFVFHNGANPNQHELVGECVMAKNKQLPDTCSVAFNQNQSKPVVALVSYPGSGNTWSRHLIEKSTGIFTGSLYSDKKLFEEGNFCGEKLTPWTFRTVATKTHFHLKGSSVGNTSQVSKAILLIRNPFKALIAYQNYRLTQSLTKHVNKSHFQGEEWIKFCKSSTAWWRNVYSNWLDQPIPIHILKFEDLKNDKEEAISKVTTFLGYPNDRKHCLKTNTEGAFHRKTTCNDTMNPFTEELQNIINENINMVNQKLQKKGFDKLDYSINALQCQK